MSKPYIPSVDRIFLTPGKWVIFWLWAGNIFKKLASKAGHPHALSRLKIILTLEIIFLKTFFILAPLCLLNQNLLFDILYTIFVFFKGQKPFTQVLAFTKAASNSCITTSLLRCLVTEKTKTMKQQTTAVWVFQTQCIRFIIFLNFMKKFKYFLRNSITRVWNLFYSKSS